MNDQHYLINGQMWLRFVKVVKELFASEIGRKAGWLCGGLLALLLSVNVFNVLNSYVGRDFMTAVAERNQPAFALKAFLYILVFAVSTAVTVLHRYAEDSLGLLFREWLTKRTTQAYLERPMYYRLKVDWGIKNPDERIADDVRTFTITTLSIILMLLNASVTFILFSGVLWSISPSLFFIAVGYATLGSYFSIKLGRPLVGLNSQQLDKDADFRASLIHVRENAELIALTRREGRLLENLQRRIQAFADNMRKIFIVNRNLNFFSTGYFNMMQVIPVLVVAPLFFRGEVEFGVVTQSVMAFGMLVGAFSLVVSQFQPLSSFTAASHRLNQFWEDIDKTKQEVSGIKVDEFDGIIAYQDLSLYSPKDGKVLLRNLNLSINHGTRLLISGPNEDAKRALFMATAGLYSRGEGKIIRPNLDNLRFLPQRAYLYPGTLRELLLRSGVDHPVSDEQILETLKELKLDAVLARAEGLDKEQEQPWESLISLSEEQLLAFTRLLLAKPQFAFLDRVYTALPDQAAQILIKLSLEKITYIALDEAKNLPQLFDAELEIEQDGSWTFKINE